MGHLIIPLQVLGIAFVIAVIISAFVVVYMLIAVWVHGIRSRRREERLSKKFFNNIERCRSDFS